MKTIKFSHRYSKLCMSFGNPIESAVLLDVIPVKIEDLSEGFKNYDTDFGCYSLPKKGEFMMLLFKHINMNQMFPLSGDIRPRKPDTINKILVRNFELWLVTNE